MSEVLTNSIQDYLKHIYDLSAEGHPASTNDLAARLGVTPASVTGMIQRLANTIPPLVRYRKHQGVTLTPEGERAALEVIRHHRLLETYLVQSLGYSWDEVHSEAEKLEHVISEEFEARIAAALGNPIRDPHGDLIPSADLIMPKDESVLLSSLKRNQEAVICKVQSQNTDLLKHLEGLELVIGARVKTIEVSPYDQVMKLQIHGRKGFAVLGPAITNKVFIEILHKG